jgi:hypothetical protein
MGDVMGVMLRLPQGDGYPGDQPTRGLARRLMVARTSRRQILLEQGLVKLERKRAFG